MIYLIDDNRRDQQQEYNCGFLTEGTFSAIVKPIYKLMPDQDLNFLKGADAVLVHSSFPDFNAEGKVIEGQAKVYEAIQNLLQDEPDIPNVMFSNGDTEPFFDLDNPLALNRLNKRLFYLHLRDFLVNYEKRTSIELRILAYGKNFLSRDMLTIFDQMNKLFLAGVDLKGNTEIEKLSSQFTALAGEDPRIMVMLTAVLKGELAFGSYLNYLEKIIKSYIRHGRNIYYQ